METARAVRTRPWISPPVLSAESAGRGESTGELVVCAAATAAVAVRRKSAVVRLAGKLKVLGVISLEGLFGEWILATRTEAKFSGAETRFLRGLIQLRVEITLFVEIFVPFFLIN